MSSGPGASAGSSPAVRSRPPRHGRSVLEVASRRLPPRSSRSRTTSPSAAVHQSVRFAPSNISGNSKRSKVSRPLRPWRKSAPFRAGYFLVAEALSAPLQGGFRLLRRSSTPSAIPFLVVGIPSPCSDGTSGAYPVVQCGEAEAAPYRVMAPPSSRVPIDDPMPFWLRPVSTFGRFSITDLDHGRSLAFSLPSSAGPLPDWCSRMLSPKLHTSDCSFACPGSSTWVDKVPSRDTPSLNLADHRKGVFPGNPQVARNQSRIGGFVTPASARMDRRPEQPSVNAVSSVLSVRPTDGPRAGAHHHGEEMGRACRAGPM